MRVLKKCIFKRRVPQQHSDKTCAERIKPFLVLFKLCGLFANDVKAGRLKSCSWSTYGICVFWIGLSISYMCCLFIYFVTLSHISLKVTIHFTKHLIGYISLIFNVVAAYSSQNHFIKVRKRMIKNSSVVKIANLSLSLSLSIFNRGK